MYPSDTTREASVVMREAIWIPIKVHDNDIVCGCYNCAATSDGAPFRPPKLHSQSGGLTLESSVAKLPAMSLDESSVNGEPASRDLGRARQRQ